MKKGLCFLLALLLLLIAVGASAENLAGSLAGNVNRDQNQEAAVYRAMREILVKANGDALPLQDWQETMTYLAKVEIGEPLNEEETIFDQSLSAYEKLFLLMLQSSTLSPEQAQSLIAQFEEALAAFPEGGRDLYMSAEGEAFLPDCMVRALEVLGCSGEIDDMDGALSLYAIRNDKGEVILSGREALTSLPSAILMKLANEEERAANAQTLALLASLHSPIDWTKKLGRSAAFDFDSQDDEEEFSENTPMPEDANEEGASDPQEQGDESDAGEKASVSEEDSLSLWLDLLFASDAYDAAVRSAGKGDLSRMLNPYEDAFEDRQRYDDRAPFQYEGRARSSDALTVSTKGGRADMKLLVLRDSFCNLLLEDISAAVGEVTYLRAMPLPLSQAEGSDAVLLEMAERRIRELLDKPPVILAMATDAPQDMEKAASSAAEIEVDLTREGARISGWMEEEPDCPAQALVGVRVGEKETWYAATPVSGLEGHEGRGFSALLESLPEGARVRAYMRSGDGAALMSDWLLPR